MFESMFKVIPEGIRGEATVQHLAITEEAARFESLRGALKGYNPVKPGVVCQLAVKGVLMMTDAPNEHDTNYDIVHQARGDVLIAGLGLGMILIPILRKPAVTSVTVVEKSADVVALVAEPLRARIVQDHAKLCIITDDIFGWPPPKGIMWDTIYFDIWPIICTDNLHDITKLKRRFARRLRVGGRQMAWVEDRLRRQKRADDSSRWPWRP